jgi:hypothetical protein
MRIKCNPKDLLSEYPDTIYEDGINTMFKIEYSRFAKKSDIFGG